ncbi:MAG: hypothetical protein ABIP89_20645 [Polyangiaceae bacterium]
MRSMKLIATTLTALTITLLAACASDGGSPAPEATEKAASDLTVVRTADPVSLTFNASDIATNPAANLPASPLTQRAFTIANVQRSLLQSGDSFATTLRAGSRDFLDSSAWHAEIDATGGQILATLNADEGRPFPQDERLLQSAALQRLASFGIPSEELAMTMQRKSMTMDEDLGTYGPAMVDGYKTFVVRSLNRVRVRGHRAVVTHGADGSFRRALIKWPALAASGHLLRTPLSTAEIVVRAERAVRAEGITVGNVSLKWQYLPTTLATGEVTLTLAVVAVVPTTTETQEPRLVDVQIDAS